MSSASEQIKAGIQHGGVFLIAGPVRSGKARLLESVLTVRPCTVPLLIIDPRESSDMCVGSRRWYRASGQLLSEVLPEGDIATTSTEYFVLQEVCSTWNGLGNGRLLQIVTLTHSVVRTPEVSTIYQSDQLSQEMFAIR